MLGPTNACSAVTMAIVMVMAPLTEVNHVMQLGLHHIAVSWYSYCYTPAGVIGKVAMVQVSQALLVPAAPCQGTNLLSHGQRGLDQIAKDHKIGNDRLVQQQHAHDQDHLMTAQHAVRQGSGPPPDHE